MPVTLKGKHFNTYFVHLRTRECPHTEQLSHSSTLSTQTWAQNQWGWKRPLIPSSPSHDPTPPRQLDHGTEGHVHSFLKHLQGPWPHHSPGQAIPVPNCAFWEEILLRILRGNTLLLRRNSSEDPTLFLTPGLRRGPCAPPPRAALRDHPIFPSPMTFNDF